VPENPEERILKVMEHKCMCADGFELFSEWEPVEIRNHKNGQVGLTLAQVSYYLGRLRSKGKVERFRGQRHGYATWLWKLAEFPQALSLPHRRVEFLASCLHEVKTADPESFSKLPSDEKRSWEGHAKRVLRELATL
jgi:hypothetical protein